MKSLALERVRISTSKGCGTFRKASCQSSCQQDVWEATLPQQKLGGPPLLSDHQTWGWRRGTSGKGQRVGQFACCRIPCKVLVNVPDTNATVKSYESACLITLQVAQARYPHHTEIQRHLQTNSFTPFKLCWSHALSLSLSLSFYFRFA